MIAFGHDIIMAALSFGISMALRLGDLGNPLRDTVLLSGTAAFTATAAVVFLSLRMYRGIWRYASTTDLVTLAKAVSILILIFSFEMFFFFRHEGLPRSVPIINWFVLLAMLGGPRFLYRMIKDRRYGWHLDLSATPKIPVLLVGAGDEAELFIRDAARSKTASYRPMGIIAESSNRVGRHIHGVEVLGTLTDIKQVLTGLNGENRPRRLVLTKDTLKGSSVRELLELAQNFGMTMARMPRVDDLQSDGENQELRIRPIAIEDLLGRPQQPLDRDAMTALAQNKRILITGAGGSIGSELVRQLAEIGPKELVLVENSEFALYLVDRELAERHPALTRHAVIADVRDRTRIDQVFAHYKPELVFHAAALKHVPLVEDNVFEGMRTNAIGTRNVADACVAAGVDVMVMISTDKAVNPTNIMGATKRIAETYVQALDLKRGADNGTRFVTVRFGNVLGSTGSVVPLFQKQLQAGGPLTVTHPDMTRYFMTIREAVELVLQASALGASNHASNGKLFVLDMGEPVKIVDLARQMIRLAGYVPDQDIQIQFTGTRPGEKLFEEIFHGAEPLVPTKAPGVLLASPRTQDVDQVRATLDALDTAARAEDRDGLLLNIAKLVPEYAPPPAVQDLSPPA
ncbi:nucleotide sugar dehydratase [Magnetovibrio blakemorei]|uniref:Nucleotide sugar dehydratase n=2 Tax=Magnetovibrio blakemorei TaxID=28181 RepID=A0A1E5Q3S1_9PROT|nr:nucleotide sugar dehydratase [Magnetovibrio blakemorei]